MKLFYLGQKYRLINRVRVAAGIFLKHGMGYFIDRILKEPYLSFTHWKKLSISAGTKQASLPERLRAVLEELGPTYIKIGQFFSTRPDILPEEYIRELSKLQDAVPPFSYTEVQAIVAEEFGKPLEEVFPGFSLSPVFSASIAQVHTAKLSSGKNCVVKVQRPGIEKTINQDIEVIDEFAKLAFKHMPELRTFHIQDVLDEFGENLKRQLDFIYEAGMTEKLRKFYAKTDIVVPEIYWEFTTRRIITMEELGGIKITDAAGKDPEVPKKLVKAFFHILFETGYFHGDMHPGNILISGDGKIGLVDFGLMGYLSFEKRKNLAIVVSGLLKGDLETSVPYIKKFFGIMQKEPESFEREINFFIDKYGSLPLHKINLGNIIRDLLKIGRKLSLKIIPELGLLGKTLANLESICLYFDPGLNLLELSREYWEPLAKKGILQHFWFEDVKNTLNSYGHLIKNFPEEYESFLRLNEQRVQEEQRLIEKLSVYHRSIEIAGNRIAFGIVVLPIITLVILLAYRHMTTGHFVLFAVLLFIMLEVIIRIISRREDE